MIEFQEGVLQIIDYKTGTVSKNNITTSDDFLYNDEYKVPSQLVIYGWMASRLPQYQSYQIKSAFVAMKKRKDQKKAVTCLGSEYFTSEINAMIETNLENFIMGMLNPESSFFRTDNVNHCKYCDYKSICNR
jgi:hypothetical protein